MTRYIHETPVNTKPINVTSQEDTVVMTISPVRTFIPKTPPTTAFMKSQNLLQPEVFFSSIISFSMSTALPGEEDIWNPSTCSSGSPSAYCSNCPDIVLSFWKFSYCLATSCIYEKCRVLSFSLSKQAVTPFPTRFVIPSRGISTNVPKLHISSARINGRRISIGYTSLPEVISLVNFTR